MEILDSYCQCLTRAVVDVVPQHQLSRVGISWCGWGSEIIGNLHHRDDVERYGYGEINNKQVFRSDL